VATRVCFCAAAVLAPREAAVTAVVAAIVAMG
jgi:hypothetical protein